MTGEQTAALRERLATALAEQFTSPGRLEQPTGERFDADMMVTFAAPDGGTALRPVTPNDVAAALLPVVEAHTAEETARLRDERDRLAEVLEHVEGMVACDSRDWGAWHRDAWLYGILVGWDCKEDHEHDDVCQNGEAMRELAERHGWSDEDVARLRRYRQTVTEVQR